MLVLDGCCSSLIVVDSLKLGCRAFSHVSVKERSLKNALVLGVVGADSFRSDILKDLITHTPRLHPFNAINTIDTTMTKTIAWFLTQYPPSSHLFSGDPFVKLQTLEVRQSQPCTPRNMAYLFHMLPRKPVAGLCSWNDCRLAAAAASPLLRFWLMRPEKRVPEFEPCNCIELDLSSYVRMVRKDTYSAVTTNAVGRSGLCSGSSFDGCHSS